MAATTPRTHRHAGAHMPVSDAVRDDVVMQWRLRCTLLEEKLATATAALRASEAERRELSLDYRHVLNRLWELNARMSTRGER